MSSKPMDGRVCMVTGANSGIGKETAARLAELGASVVMVCRNQEKGERAMAEIRARSGNEKVELLRADFASFESVRGCARQFLAEHEALNVLVNNAGLAKATRSVTADGFETTFQVDYLSHFLLTNLLLDALKRGAPSRIVTVSSIAHYNGHLDFDDLQMEHGYGVMKAYSRAKLAEVLFTFELARRLEGTGVTANCLHPGAVATNIWGNAMGPLSFVGKATRLFLISPKKGAETPVYLASSPDVEGVTGKYFDDMRVRKPSDESNDRGEARRLWETSEGLAGLN